MVLWIRCVNKNNSVYVSVHLELEEHKWFQNKNRFGRLRNFTDIHHQYHCEKLVIPLICCSPMSWFWFFLVIDSAYKILAPYFLMTAVPVCSESIETRTRSSAVHELDLLWNFWRCRIFWNKENAQRMVCTKMKDKSEETMEVKS